MKMLVNRTILFLILSIWITPLGANSPGSGSGIGNDNGGPKQSWQDIYRNPNLKPDFPSYKVEKREIEYKNLCLIGERIRTKYKYVVHLNVTKIVYDFLYTDRVRFEERCLEFDGETCVSYDTVKVEIPLKQEIKVFERESNANGGQPVWELAFKKDFKLQACPDQVKFPKVY